jgi:integrase
VPAVDKKEQNRPSFDGETVTALIATAANPTVQLLSVILAATGLRPGEALGVRIEKILDEHTQIVVDQKAWRNEIQTFLKTPNGEREIDLHPSAGTMLKAFIGERRLAVPNEQGETVVPNQSLEASSA